jgi:hypothetical protein
LLLHLHIVQVHFYCDRRGIAIPKVPCGNKSNIVFVAMATASPMDLQLRNVPFEGNDTKNANNTQEMADVVGNLLEDAAKKKLKMKFKMREVMEKINVAQLTRAYVADGMSALRPDGIKKSTKRSQKSGRHINTAAWSKIRKLAKGEASGEESGEKNNTADPIATSS